MKQADRLERRIAAVLRRNGCEIVLRDAASGNTHAVWASIMPYMHRNRQYLEERLTVLGRGEPNSFLYLGEYAKGEGEAEPGDFVRDDDRYYVFSSCTTLRYRGVPVYVWGVLKKAEGEYVAWSM